MAEKSLTEMQKVPAQPKFGWMKKIEPQYLGLKVLFQPSEIDDIELDIVAVHGIGVHPSYTWIHKNKVNWLSDPTMLPAAIPKARIMAYGYESYWFGDDAVRQSLDSVASDLLDALGEERGNCLHRPLIFVGHCFGGLVIQQAYTLASLHRNDYPGISDSVTGVVFLGTPHSGVNGNSEFHTQGQIYKAVVEANVEVQDNVLHTLAHDNDVLVNAVHHFTRAITDKGNLGPKLFSFFEMKSSKIGRIAGINMKSEFVVSGSSASLDGHLKAGLPLDHFMMNKFENSEDNNYKSVRRQIVKMVNGSKAIIDGRGLASEKPPSASSSASPRPHLSSIPAPIARESHFAPRGDILKRIETGFERTTIQVLRGDSGNGKTHIAVEYAHKFHREHPGSTVYWVNGGSPAQFELSYKRIAENLHLNTKMLKDDSIVEAVYETLKRDINAHWLMILDGLDDKMDLKATEFSIAGKSLLDFIPNCPLARVLMTTRSKRLAMRMVNNNREHAIPVPSLEDDDSSFLLLGKNTSVKTQKKIAVDVTKALGGSAGTITMAYLYRLSAGVTLDNYMEIIRSPTQSDKEDPGAMRAWRLLFKRIKDAHPADAGLLLLIGSLDVQSIPNIFFERIPQRSEQIPRLVNSGMVEPSADGRLYTVTALIRHCVHTWLIEEDEKDMVEDQALSVMCERFKEKEYYIGEALLPCALAVLNFHPTSAEGRRSLANLLFKIADYYTALGQYRMALDKLKRCLCLRQEDLEKKDSLVIETTQAIEQVKNKLSLSESEKKTSDKKDKSADRIAEAKKDIEELKKSDKRDKSEIVRKENELATSQLMQGKEENPKAAVALYQSVLDWCKKNRGEDSIDTARRKYNLALAYDEAGEYDKAVELHQSASQIAERYLEPGHPELLRFLSSLACMYGRQDRLKEAQKAFEVVLAGQQKALGLDHPETLITRQNVAMVLESMGEEKTAATELEEIMGIQIRLLGAKDPAVFRTSCSLAMNYRLQGLLDEAEKLFKATLKNQKKLLGKTHRDTVMTKKMLDECLEEMGKPKAGLGS